MTKMTRGFVVNTLETNCKK